MAYKPSRLSYFAAAGLLLAETLPRYPIKARDLSALVQAHSPSRRERCRRVFFGPGQQKDQWAAERYLYRTVFRRSRWRAISLRKRCNNRVAMGTFLFLRKQTRVSKGRCAVIVKRSLFECRDSPQSDYARAD